jgi:co-chaperonin GroES (HSP10)
MKEIDVKVPGDSTGWDNEDAVHPEGFFDGIKPIYWRMLVMPVRPKVRTKSGILIASSTQEAQEVLTYVGKVVGMGSKAGKDQRLDGEPHAPKVGDYVIFGRYAGQKITYKNVKLLLVNDDEILSVVTDPEDLRIHI